MAFEWLIQGRDDDTCVLRLVQSGVMGDDWETEYDALVRGWDMYLHQLAQYLRYFRGRPATPITLMGPGPGDVDARRTEQAWQGLARPAVRRRLERRPRMPDAHAEGLPEAQHDMTRCDVDIWPAR
jgi:hypothetical protein